MHKQVTHLVVREACGRVTPIIVANPEQGRYLRDRMKIEGQKAIIEANIVNRLGSLAAGATGYAVPLRG